MDGVKVARGVVGLLASSGAAYTVSNALRNLNDPVTKYQRVKTVVGAYTIGAMVGDLAERYAVREFNKGVEQVENLKRKWSGMRVDEGVKEDTAADEPQDGFSSDEEAAKLPSE